MFGNDTTLAAPVTSDAKQIALGLRHRDVAMLHTLVEQYQYRLVRYLHYLLGRSDGVEDLAQETWLRLLERGSSYDGRSRFEPWLFSIAHNLGVDYLRKRHTVSLDSNAGSTRHSEEILPPSTAPSPFTLAARTEDAAWLADSLQNLDPLCREALVLRFQEDLSLQEISTIVGAPVSTVASSIYRGLAKLRQQLEGRKS